MVSAGDLERFTYCAHNWWLSQQGVDPGNEGSARGIQEHAAKGEALQEYQSNERERRRALSWAFRGILALGSITILTLEALYFQATTQGIILLITGLVLVSATTGLLVIAFIQERQAKRIMAEAADRHGKVVSDDLTGAGRTMEDPEWDLAGTPDYVMETDDGLIPVEVKTGKTPDAPFPSHIMQVACYLRLLEVHAPEPPKYGLLTYPDRTFQVPWDAATRNQLRDVVDRIHAAQASGVADRDHEHAGRCYGCARRSACKQSLA